MMDNELLAKLLDDRGDLSAEEWRQVLAALQDEPALADELHELLLTDELLSQKLSSDRRAFSSALQLRMDDRNTIRLEDIKALDAKRHEEQLHRFWRTRRIAAVASVLLVALGALAFWLVPGPADRLTEHQERCKQNILEQLHDLNLAREAIALPPEVPKVEVKPGAPPVEKTVAQQDAEDAARIIEARRRFMMRQLRQFERSRTLPNDLDVDEADARSGPAVVPETEPVAVGRVTMAGGQRAGYLVREEGQTRQALTEGLTLLSGDHIETPQGGDAPCASVQIDGGATLDLAQDTTIELLGRDSLRLRSGRLYAHIAVPGTEDGYAESGPPFSLQTEAGRFLTHEVQAEIYLSPNEVLHKDLTARVASGKVHLMNGKGHVVGRRGQELKARAEVTPSRQEGFTEVIWLGRGSHLADLPFGLGSPVILSTYTPVQHSGMHYAMAMALRGEIKLQGLQTSLGTTWDSAEQLAFHKDLVSEVRKLQPFSRGRIPQPALGALQALPVPSPRVLSRTRAIRTDAALQILAAARTATSDQPLLVLCHGSMTDVACAWLMDPSITQRVIVAGEKNRANAVWSAWNCDPWSGEIVLRNFRYLLLYHDGLNVDRALLEQVSDPRWISLRDNRTGSQHKFSLLYHLTNPEARMHVRRIRFDGTRDDKPVFVPDSQGTIWEIQSSTTQEQLLQEFRRIFLEPAGR